MTNSSKARAKNTPHAHQTQIEKHNCISTRRTFFSPVSLSFSQTLGWVGAALVVFLAAFSFLGLAAAGAAAGAASAGFSALGALGARGFLAALGLAAAAVLGALAIVIHRRGKGVAAARERGETRSDQRNARATCENHLPTSLCIKQTGPFTLNNMGSRINPRQQPRRQTNRGSNADGAGVEEQKSTQSPSLCNASSWYMYQTLQQNAGNIEARMTTQHSSKDKNETARENSPLSAAPLFFLPTARLNLHLLYHAQFGQTCSSNRHTETELRAEERQQNQIQQFSPLASPFLSPTCLI